MVKINRPDRPDKIFAAVAQGQERNTPIFSNLCLGKDSYPHKPQGHCQAS